MKPSYTTTHLELHVPDFGPVKDYYGKLGFHIAWEREPDEFKGYLIMKLDDNVLCFWAGNKFVHQQPYFKNFPNNTKRGYGVEIIIMVQDIESYYEKVKAFANVVEPLVIQPWELKDFRTEDPFGYYLRFTSKHNVLDDTFAVE